MRAELNLDLRVLDVLRDAAADGLSDAAEFLLDESQRVVPEEEGTLLGSGQVTVDRDELVAVISYDTPYAVRQHEDLTLRHDAGRKAKFLEDPMKELGGQAFDHVADRVRQASR